MNEYFADLHVHIGASSSGRPVKITASRDLNFANIVAECVNRKGIQLVGIIDAASPAVLEDIQQLLKKGEMEELPQGGLTLKPDSRLYQNISGDRPQELTVILGAEVETSELSGGFHVLCYFPYLGQMINFSRWLAGFQKNIYLSSQRAKLSFAQLWEQVSGLGGLVVPAHVFTPHKGMYGCSCARIGEVLPAGVPGIAGIELGLSSDSFMADTLSELAGTTFLTNSDAHSLPKIGREYNLIAMERPDFAELKLALAGQQGRRVVKNFGLDPKLGKYHRTFCLVCNEPVEGGPPIFTCPRCGARGRDIVNGVLDRLASIADVPDEGWDVCGEGRSVLRDGRLVLREGRPPYIYQVPLQFLPGLGPKMLNKLLARFGTEMAVLHQAPEEELREISGEKVASMIIAAREGKLALVAGGGGRYGRVNPD
ncbi:MAG TPA: endonuclease Q family protein [Bacillota bacterium]|nr:endonuclease Q family protein [Bacillota bacterium]